MFFGVVYFLQKMNENKSHCSKVEFIRSFFGGNRWPQKLFRNTWPLITQLSLKQKTLKSPIVSSTLNHLCTSGSAYARMFIATKLRVAFTRTSVSQSTLRNPEKPSVRVKPVKPVHEPIWRFFYPLPVCVYLYANFLLCIYFSNSA